MYSFNIQNIRLEIWCVSLYIVIILICMEDYVCLEHLINKNKYGLKTHHDIKYVDVSMMSNLQQVLGIFENNHK